MILAPIKVLFLLHKTNLNVSVVAFVFLNEPGNVARLIGDMRFVSLRINKRLFRKSKTF